MADSTENIECAAILYDGIVFKVPRPGRHHDVCRIMADCGFGPDTMRIQGFVTTTGRFVDRREACVIATNAGQILVKTNPDYELFSEDMW